MFAVFHTLRSLPSTIRSGALLALLALAGCAAPDEFDRRGAIAEIASREITIPTYPQAGRSYLAFGQAHGFQVIYFADADTSWLWYPGNERSLPARYRMDDSAGWPSICFLYGSDTFNPVTGVDGGTETCSPLAFVQRTIVAELPGDRFSLEGGAVPYARDRCVAPPEFSFNRARFAC